jgi:hypothetical protein
LSVPTLDGFVQTIKIVEVGNIALHSGYIPANLSGRRVQRVLTPAGDKHMIHSFFDEALGRGQAHAGGRSRLPQGTTLKFGCFCGDQPRASTIVK